MPTAKKKVKINHRRLKPLEKEATPNQRSYLQEASLHNPDSRILNAVRSCLKCIPKDLSSMFADDLHDEGYTDQEIGIILAGIELRINTILY